MAFSSDLALQSNQLSVSIEYPETDSKEFTEILTLDRKRIVDSVNTKEGALYLLNEIASFKQYFTVDNPQLNRNGYRKTFDIVNLNGGPIPGGVTVNFPHQITGISSAIMIYAGVTCPADPTFNFFSVMYPYVWLSNTDVFFMNPSASPATNVYVVAEYLKQN